MMPNNILSDIQTARYYIICPACFVRVVEKNSSMMTLHILFVSLLFLSSVRPFLQENFYNSEIPFLNGTGCLESSPTQDLKIAWLEITWRLINFKEYYRICQTLKRPFQILHQFQLPADKYGKSHFVDLIFRLAPPGFFLFCGSYTPCSSGDFLQDTVEMVIHDGQRSVDMFATGYEYEADLTYSTVNGVIKTSIGRATKSPQYGIIFKLGGDINRTEFQTVLQPPITENLLQLYFVVKQWRNPDPVSMMELETNCNLQTL